MIKYKLICEDCRNSFDSWFLSSKEYEKLKRLKHLNCHKCSSINIKKTLMSPNIFGSEKDKKLINFRKKIREYQKFIKNNFEDVGKNFAFEARSMHYNKKESKGIYGKATPEEISELKEEGIETELFPWIENSDN